ncbi:MAG: hypothetical protein ACSLEN_10865 [Candidatus Malihini olakiniferum]
MSELDVDGVLISNMEIVSSHSQNMISITTNHISSDAGIAKFNNAIGRFLRAKIGREKTSDFILLDTSGRSHPLPPVYYITRSPSSLPACIFIAHGCGDAP